MPLLELDINLYLQSWKYILDNSKYYYAYVLIINHKALLEYTVELQNIEL